MIDHLSDVEILRLAAIADRAIGACLVRAGSSGTKLREVRAVEAMVTDGMPSVAKRWRRQTKLSGLRGLKLQSVFCHAAPKVLFSRSGGGGQGCCELADLLLVIDDLSARVPEERRRAVLIQAKLQNLPGHLHLNSKNERVQFELLSEWPAFSFQASLYKPHARDFSFGPSSRNLSGEYGGIDQPPPGAWSQYLIAGSGFSPSPPVCGAVSLGQLVAGMLAGRIGYGRPGVPLGRDPWSETVQELLDVTFRLPLRASQPLSKRGRASHLSFNRHVGLGAGWNIPKGIAPGAPVPPREDDADWPDGAISVVRFVTGEPETAVRRKSR